MPEALRVGDPPIEVRLRRDPRARRLILRLARDTGGPVLTVPPGLSLATARAFLNDQEAWLRGRLAARPALRRVAEGTTLPFGDGTLTLLSIPNGRLRRDGDRLLVPGAAEALPRKVAVFLRAAARDACAAQSARHAAALQRRVARISLRDPRSRWGSCTATGELMFSWRLILAPSAVLDYVAAHEAAHLVEMNHGPRFWALVARLCPAFQTYRDWLRRHGPDLHCWDFSHPSA